MVGIELVFRHDGEGRLVCIVSGRVDDLKDAGLQIYVDPVVA